MKVISKYFGNLGVISKIIINYERLCSIADFYLYRSSKEEKSDIFEKQFLTVIYRA